MGLIITNYILVVTLCSIFRCFHKIHCEPNMRLIVCKFHDNGTFIEKLHCHVSYRQYRIQVESEAVRELRKAMTIPLVGLFGPASSLD